MLLAADGNNLKETAAAARALAEVCRASLAIRQDRRKILKEVASSVDQRLARAEADVANADDPLAALQRVRQDLYGIFDT